jgi:adenylate cyclase
LPGLRERIRTLERRAVSAGADADEQLNRTLLIFASALMGFGSVLWVAIYRLMGVPFSVAVPLGYLAVSAASLVHFLWRGDFALFRTIQLALFLFVPFAMQWSIGSFVSASGVMLWALLAPLGVMMLAGPRAAVPWVVAYGVMTAASGLFDYYLDQPPPAVPPMRSVAVFFSLNFAGVSAILCVLFGFFIRQKQRLGEALDQKHRELAVEQSKSERLLLSILPAPIAQRLKDEQTIADAHPEVTVMFADIVGFTRMSEEVTPREIVAMLNDVFSGFDALSERYGLEKIKTIGDAYMVAGGLGGAAGSEAAVAAMALEARAQVARHPGVASRRLALHIGISTGPVVAGVIGVRRFIYDLWGNTVNVASRLSSEAPPGTILVDEASYARLDGRYRFSPARTIVVKGKGPMTVYLLEDAGGAAQAAAGPGAATSA